MASGLGWGWAVILVLISTTIFISRVKAIPVLTAVTEGEPFNISCTYALPGYWTIHPLLVNTEEQGECTERNGVTYYQCHVNRAQLTDAGNYTFSILPSANPGTQLDICHVQITVQPIEGTNTVSSGSLPHSTIISASLGIGLSGILIILILFIVISISIYLAMTRRQTYSPESADLSTSANQRPPAVIVTANKSIDINDNICYANKSAVATSEIPQTDNVAYDHINSPSKEADGTVNTYVTSQMTTNEDSSAELEYEIVVTSQMTTNEDSSAELEYDYIVTPPLWATRDYPLDGSVADKDQVTDAIEDVPTTLNTIDDAQEDYDCETTF